MSTFNSSEIYQFAIKIEENGEKFYRQMVTKLPDKKVKELFTFLADEEVQHKATFSAMLSKFEDYKPAESYPGEYFAYLKAYADNLVFGFGKFDEDIANIENAETALQFAIGKELDTIMYFQEMKNLVPESERKRINAIIEEERRHVVKLSELKRSL
ncbi:MAG: ferritin family protein [Candidatus Marinimicrobia bacterium]|nr:ferritin family protein [bacterium]MCG2716655.1 ferritin family protein [Candidatus Neomarinimicrobiota bacterium]